MTWKPINSDEIPVPVNGWHCLLLLIDYYPVWLLATAIDKAGIYVIDQYGGISPATDDDKADMYSKSNALKLLSDVYAEQQNPSEQFSWNAERWDTETHPLSLFGWPSTHLPDFKNFASSQNPQPESSSKWRQREFVEFDNELKRAGSFTAAARLHHATRQDYTRVYNRQKLKADTAASPLAQYKK